MYRKVLIPLDGSPFAERILPHIERLISSAETELILFHVVEPFHHVVSPETRAGLTDAEITNFRESATLYLKRVRGELREMGLQAHVQTAHGDVASAICDTAQAQGADLIAMTTHGRSGVGRWAFGSVADRVIRTASQPVLLVRGTTDTPSNGEIRRILVPLDGSELAERALPHATKLAQEKDAEVLLVRAVEPLTDLEFAGLFASWESPEAVYQHRQTAAQRYLEQVQQDLKVAGVPSSTLVDEGRAADLILDTVEAENADMIVMSTHGRSGLARWVYGSVADKVLRNATCPLLLIRAIEMRGDQR
ncbi:MAG: universal stress protein [Chloroflexi bacterium]|nr:MAG: universal stress protein [Chloroflexota bacterium]